MVVKVAKPNQDLRFDLPVIGMESLKIFEEAQVAALELDIVTLIEAPQSTAAACIKLPGASDKIASAFVMGGRVFLDGIFKKNSAPDIETDKTHFIPK